MRSPGDDGFIWFFGIVDSIDDPLQLGRLKVRIIDEYDEQVDQEDIPWATVLGPTTSASFLGVGQSPTGILPGTRVIGFYLDAQEKSKPVVMGTLPFINNGEDTEHSVASVARGKGAIQKDYLGYEPQSAYASQYPLNNTITTRSGHVIELDDTPKAERVHIYHKSGAYIEIFPDGRIVTKSPKDNIEISIGDKNLVSDEGAVNVSAKKNIDLVSVEGEGAMVAKNDVGIVSQEGSALVAGKNKVVVETEKTEIKSDTDVEGKLDVSDDTKVGGDLNVDGKTSLEDDVSITGAVTIRGAVNVRGSLRVNGRRVDLK